MDNKISFNLVLEIACIPSHEWLKANRSKGLRWIITELLKQNESWMQEQCFHAGTNVSYPAAKLRRFYKEGTIIREAIEGIVENHYIDDGLTLKAALMVLKFGGIDDEFAD